MRLINELAEELKKLIESVESLTKANKLLMNEVYGFSNTYEAMEKFTKEEYPKYFKQLEEEKYPEKSQEGIFEVERKLNGGDIAITKNLSA